MPLPFDIWEKFPPETMKKLREHNADKDDTCPICKGEGSVLAPLISKHIPREDIECNACGGTGKKQNP